MPDFRAADSSKEKSSAGDSSSSELIQDAIGIPRSLQMESKLPEALLKRGQELTKDWTPPSPLQGVVEERNAKAATKIAEKEIAPPKTEDTKPEVVRSGEKNRVLSQLSPADRTTVNTLRMELSVATADNERSIKQAEIQSFLKPKLGDALYDSGIREITAGSSTSDLLKEIKGDRPEEFAQLKAELRQRILSHADMAITDPGRRKDFAEKLTKFDERSKGLSDSEAINTYLQLGRVLDPSLKLEHGHRAVLAHSLLANVAVPTSIDQGGHNTCNVTTMQVRLFAQEPGLASKVVADVAVGGQFVSADGTVVKPLNLDPDGEAKTYPNWDGSRNYASQIFQLTAINIYWNRRETLPGGKTPGKGKIQYAQDEHGEFLLDTSVNPPQKQSFATVDADHPWLDVRGVSEINQQITGRPSKNFGVERWVYPSESEGITKLMTLGGFKERLLELKQQNAFPVIISVDAAKKPFGDGKGFGPHVVTITDYDPEKQEVSVDNQWGSSNDFTGLPGQRSKLPVSEIWSAMSQMPGLDFFKDKAKHALDGLAWKDTIKPTYTALSAKGLGFGLSATAPWAVRGGLGYLSEWGLPGAAKALQLSETRLGGITLRAGTGLAALGAFAYINDLPSAFKQGNSYGVGKLTRVAGDYLSFEIGRGIIQKATSWVPYAPARFGLQLAGGIATTTVFDKLLGEGSEIGGSYVYDYAHDYLTKPSGLPKVVEKPAPSVETVTPNPTPGKELKLLDGGSMTQQFMERSKRVRANSIFNELENRQVFKHE